LQELVPDVSPLPDLEADALANMNKTQNFDNGKTFDMAPIIPGLSKFKGDLITENAFWTQRENQSKLRKTVFSMDRDIEVDTMMSPRPPTGL
jgi:hypothetical protein